MTTQARVGSGVDAATVFVVDDDPSVRTALSRLLRVAGLQMQAFPSVEDFFKREPSEQGGCIILDIALPGLSGLELQDTLSRDGGMPIIFITGHGDIPMSVRAMKNGAVDFLTKPFDVQDILAAVGRALERDRESRSRNARVGVIRRRIETLTDRERDVMRQVVTGALNKQIAAELGISEKTVKTHRGRVMTKMGIASVAELVLACADAER